MLVMGERPAQEWLRSRIVRTNGMSTLVVSDPVAINDYDSLQPFGGTDLHGSPPFPNSPDCTGAFQFSSSGGIHWAAESTADAALICIIHCSITKLKYIF